MLVKVRTKNYGDLELKNFIPKEFRDEKLIKSIKTITICKDHYIVDEEKEEPIILENNYEDLVEKAIFKAHEPIILGILKANIENSTIEEKISLKIEKKAIKLTLNLEGVSLNTSVSIPSVETANFQGIAKQLCNNLSNKIKSNKTAINSKVEDKAKRTIRNNIKSILKEMYNKDTSIENNKITIGKNLRLVKEESLDTMVKELPIKEIPIKDTIIYEIDEIKAKDIAQSIVELYYMDLEDYYFKATPIIEDMLTTRIKSKIKKIRKNLNFILDNLQANYVGDMASGITSKPKLYVKFKDLSNIEYNAKHLDSIIFDTVIEKHCIKPDGLIESTLNKKYKDLVDIKITKTYEKVVGTIESALDKYNLTMKRKEGSGLFVEDTIYSVSDGITSYPLEIAKITSENLTPSLLNDIVERVEIIKKESSLKYKELYKPVVYGIKSSPMFNRLIYDIIKTMVYNKNANDTMTNHKLAILLKDFKNNTNFNKNPHITHTYSSFTMQEDIDKAVRLLLRENYIVEKMKRYRDYPATPYIEITDKAKKYIEQIEALEDNIELPKSPNSDYPTYVNEIIIKKNNLKGKITLKKIIPLDFIIDHPVLFDVLKDDYIAAILKLKPEDLANYMAILKLRISTKDDDRPEEIRKYILKNLKKELKRKGENTLCK